MSYTKTNWQTGDVISKARLNHAEQGIYDNAEDITALKNDFTSILMHNSSGITDWEQGGIRDSGTLLDSTTRIRTSATVNIPNNIVTIVVASGFAFGYREYRTVAGTGFIAGDYASTWYSGSTDITIDPTHYYKFILKKSDESAITPNDVDDTTLTYTFFEPVIIRPKWELGNIGQSGPWNTDSTTRARTALDCIPIFDKTTIKFDSTVVKVSIRLYNHRGKYYVPAGSSSDYFDTYDYSSDWNDSGEITINANAYIRYYRLCVAYVDDRTITSPEDIGKLVTIEKYGETVEFCVDMESVPVNAENAINRTRPQFATICAIKELHRESQPDKTVGYLYRDNKAPFNFYYASGGPENPKQIFTWDASITDTGSREPMDYCFAVTYEGDVIAVFRGEINGNSNQSGPVRGNPIVYPHNDYEHPVVIDLSADTQPTSWLMNTGVYCEQGAMYFVEYTRPRHSKAYLWKVAAPYTSASDWSIKHTYNTTTSGQEGTGDIEHWHHVTRDPFSQIMYASTGDEDFESKILYSTDNGNTWSVLREGDQKICRQLNFIFLKDAVYWATDSVSTAAPRVLCKTTRDANGLLKLTDNDVEILFEFKKYVAFATYHICYIGNPEGLLLLERSDSKSATYIGTFYFWDFATSNLYYAGSFEPNGSVYNGFRNEAVSHYPALPNDNRVICGFSMFPDEIKYRGNPSVADYIGKRGVILSDAYNDDLYNNLVLEVKPLTDYHYNGNQ